MNRKHPIDEYFKQGLEAHETAPSASVWDKIAPQVAPASSKRKGGFYFMRAAVITLLLGLSTWLYFEGNEQQLMAPAGQIEEQQTGPELSSPTTVVEEEKKEPAQKDAKEVPAGEERVKPAEKDGGSSPVVNPSAGRKQIYVAQPLTEEKMQEGEMLPELSASEGKMMAQEEVPVTQETESSEPARYRVKLKLNPSTVESFYAAADSTAGDKSQEKIGERLLAYANNQVGNLLNGRRLELPKTNKKPQLEIDLPRFLN